MTLTRIWKYQLYVRDEPQKIMMPEGAKIVFVHDQNGVPCFWAEVQPRKEYEPRWFGVYGTGHIVPESNMMFKHNYVGSTISGPFVWHIYELDPKAMGDIK